MKKQQGISLEKPLTFQWDKTDDLIYIYTNINLDEMANDFGDISSIYTFDKYTYTTEEFFNTKFEQIQADVDYISMMTEVDL